MTFKLPAAIAILALSGCATSVPDSNPNAGGGVGFSDYENYSTQQQRNAQIQADRARRDAMLETQIASPIPEERAIAQDTLGVLNDTNPNNATVSNTEVATTPLTATTVASNNPGISDEQNFDAVASRETIESDRERLERQRANMQVIQPEAVPERPSGNAAPNIVTYALNTTNAVGQPVHRRSSRFNEDRYRRACAEFASGDQAQAAFLASGGPERDRRGLDPDGDGFACFWDPTPFRSARGG